MGTQKQTVHELETLTFETGIQLWFVTQDLAITRIWEHLGLQNYKLDK